MDRCTEKYGAQDPRTQSLQSLLAIYVDANDLWQEGLKMGRNPFSPGQMYLTNKDPVLAKMLKKYPDMGKLMDKVLFARQLDVQKGLNFLWDSARVKLEPTRNVTPATLK